MPLSPGLAAWLREQSYSAVHASEIGLSSAADLDILNRAKREHRTIVTADLDYPRLLALSRDTKPSLILFRDGNWTDADIIRRVAEVLRTLTAEEIANSIVVVDRDRVRRRRLPIE